MARTKDEQAKGTEPAFDLSDWHNGPECTFNVVPSGNGGWAVYCEKHHVIADVEAVGIRITTAASAH